MDNRQSHSNELLSSFLDKELELYREMEQVLQKEKEALLHSSHEKIIQIKREKEDILNRIENVSRSRREIARQLAESLNSERISAGTVSFHPHVLKTQEDRLQRRREEIKNILQRVYTLNRENSVLAESALRYTRSWLSYMHQLLSPQVDYQNNRHANAMILNGRMINRKE